MLPKLESSSFTKTTIVAEVPGGCVVWLSSPDADFLNGWFVYGIWELDGLTGAGERNLLNQFAGYYIRGVH
jgi:hypothetical protein